MRSAVSLTVVSEWLYVIYILLIREMNDKTRKLQLEYARDQLRSHGFSYGTGWRDPWGRSWPGVIQGRSRVRPYPSGLLIFLTLKYRKYLLLHLGVERQSTTNFFSKEITRSLKRQQLDHQVTMTLG